MADIESNININIDTSNALANIKQLQAQISAFHQNMSKGGAAANAELAKMQQNLVNTINATGSFSAQIKNVATTTESFTNALEKNKLSMGQYFRYAGSQVTGFRKVFSTEFDTIEKVARERVKTLQTQYIKLGRDANGAMKSIAVRPLALDMEDLGTKTAIAAQKQQIFNQLIKQGSTNLLNFGKNTQWAGRQLMVGFSIPLGIAGAAAAREFMKLEEQTLRLQRVYGDFTTPTEELDEMTDSLRKLSVEFTKYGIAAAKTMELAADAAAMGNQGRELLDQVTEATRLAVLGGVEQQQALDTTISLTSAFGTETEKLAGKIDFLNAVENQTVTSIEDLTEAIPKAGPVVQQLGGDVEDLTFFLTAMREGGINASEGANALKSGLASLINPTGEAVDMLASFGINLKQIVEGNAGDVKSIVIDFATALDTLDPLNRARAIEQMFGKFQFARMSTLFQNVIAEGSQAQRVLQLTQATTEELAVLSERELKRVEDSPMYKFQGAMEAFKASLAPVGEAFLTAVTPLIEFGTKILEKFNSMSDGAKNFVVVATTLVAGIGPIFLMMFGLIANGAANLIKGFQALTGFFQRLGGQSMTLGEQTDYMTMQQLEAAAVASSLNQVHQSLAQTFTSEASAVRQLAAAYQAAIAAQSRMPGGFPGKGPSPKKFASGGLVPGSGNGDTVPAMLTPGEFVLTKEIVQKYGPLIQGMVAGNVKGFELGGLVGDVVSAAAPRSQKSVEAFMQKQMAKVLAVGSDELTAKFEEFMRKSIANMQNVTEAGLKEALRNNEELTAQFNKNLVQQSKSQFAHVGEMGNMTAAKLSQSAQLTQPRSIENLDRLMKIIPEATIRPRSGFGFDIAGAVNNALGGRSGASAADLQAAFGAGGSEKWATAVKIGGGDFDNLKSQVDLFDAEMAKGIDQAVGNGAKIFFDTTQQIDEAEAKAKAAGQKFDRSIYASMDTITKQALTNIKGTGNELIKVFNTAEQTITELRVTLSQAQKAQVAAADPDLLKKMSMGGSRLDGTLTNASASAGRKFKGFGSMSPEVIGTRIVDDFMLGLATGAATRAQTASPSKVTTKVGADTAQGYINGVSQGIDDAARIGAQTANLAYNVEGPLLPGQGRDKRPPLGGRLGKVKGMLSPGRVAGAGFAVMGAASMASMVPGPVGETAQGLMGPLMGLTAILPLLTNKFGLIALLLAAIPAAIIGANMAFDSAQKSAMQLTEALSGGEKAIRGFAEFTGTVTAGEVMDKRRASQRSAFAVESGKGTFGESYIQSEAGKALMDSVGKAVKDLGKDGSIASLANQLATGVASGALNADQAKSIAANIGMELGDYDFGIEINAKLSELLGPNGENLLKDPLTVRLKILEGTQEQLNLASGRGLGNAAEIRGTDVAQIGGGIAAGAGVGAATGAGAGAAVGSVVPVIGTAVGAAVGAVAGTVIGAISGGIIGSIERNNRIAKSTGAVVALNKVALQQQQEMLDSLDLDYQKRIENAKAAGDVARVEELTNKHIADRAVLLEQSKQMMQDIADNFAAQNGDVQGALTSGVRKSIEAQYKDTPLQDVAAMATDAVTSADLTQQQEFVLLTKLDTGDISPMDLVDLMDTFKSKEDLSQVMNLVMNMDSAQFDSVMYLTNKFTDEEVKKDFVANINAKLNNSDVSAEEIQQYVDTLMGVQRLEPVIDIEAAMTYLVENEDQLMSLQADLEKIQSMDTVSIDVIANSLGQAQLDALNASAAQFAGMSAQTQKDFISNVITIYKTQGTKEFTGQYKNAKAAGFKGSKEQYGVELAKKAAADAAKSRNEQKRLAYEEEAAASAGSGGGGGGGGTVQKVKTLDNLLVKLRQVRGATIAMTEGWNESRTALDRMFGGGVAGFNGLEQQMRRFGAREDLITLVAGMDPDEYERRKNELFTFDAAGNISGLRQSLVSIAEAMRAIAMGDFQNKQQKTIQTINDQQVAIRKLVNAGMSYSDAYQAVQDTAFASAVAMEKNNSVIKETIKDANAAAIATRNLAAAQAVAAKNAEAVDQTKLLQFLEQNAGKLTDVQTQAILSDKNLQTLALSPNFDPNTFQTALDNAANQASIDLKIKKLTIGGLEEIFQDGFSKAMEAFSVSEQAIKLKFDVQKKPLLDAIKSAQEQIQDLQDGPGGLDDLDADLQRIGWQEEKINEKYQKRMDALNDVQKINEKIARQQRQQLTIADALSQGDIAAAARAVQEMRAQNVQDSAATQQKNLELAKERELANLTSTMGLTREQLEKRVLDLKQQIFEIEEQTIEPAQYRVDLLERAQQVEIDSLTVLGKTKTEWETIKNNIDSAKISSDSYQTAIEGALDVVRDIENYWNNIDGKQVAVDVVVRQTGDVNVPAMAPVAAAIGPAAEQVTGGGGGGGGGGGPAEPTYEEVPTYDPALDAVEGKKKAKEAVGDDFWGDVFGNIGTWLGEQWNGFVTWLTVDLPANLESFGKDLWSFMQSIPEWLDEQWTNFQTWLQELPVKVGIAAGMLWGHITNIATWLGEQWTNFQTWWNEELIPGIQQWGSDMWNNIQNIPTWLAEQWQKFQTWWNTELIPGIKQWGKDLWNNIQNIPAWLGEQWEKFKYWLTVTLPTNIRSFGKDVWKNMGSIATWLGEQWNGFLTELKSWPGKIARAVGDFWNWLFGGFSKGFTIGFNATQKKNNGGVIYRSPGGSVPGSGNGDVVSAMLTPGEFVVRKEAVDKYGLAMMKMINAGQYELPSLSSPTFNADIKNAKVNANAGASEAGSVYNNTYSINVNVKSDANPDQIARAVMTQIKQVDAQRIRGNRF